MDKTNPNNKYTDILLHIDIILQINARNKNQRLIGHVRLSCAR